jgi:hypothetical protein
MKPIRIEPAEIRITFEISKTELLVLKEYFDKSEPFVKRVFDNDPKMKEVLMSIDAYIKPVIEEILKHPLLE